MLGEWKNRTLVNVRPCPGAAGAEGESTLKDYDGKGRSFPQVLLLRRLTIRGRRSLTIVKIRYR